MPSAIPPLLPDDLKDLVPKASDSKCRKVGKSLIGMPVAIWRLFAWAVNADGSPSASLKAWIGTTASTSIEAPSGLTATNDLTAHVHLTWPSVAEARSYDVFRGTTGDTSAMTLLSAGVTGTGYYDTDAATVENGGKVYYYAVKANGYGIQSGFSPVAAGSAKVGTTEQVGSDAKDINYGLDEVPVPAGKTLANLWIWGAGGMGGKYSEPEWNIVGSTPPTPFAGAGGASGNFLRITDLPVSGGQVFRVGVASSTSPGYTLVELVGSESTAFAKVYSGGHGGDARYITQTPSPGQPGPAATVGSAWDAYDSGTLGTAGNGQEGGAAVAVSGKSAGEGGDGTDNPTTYLQGGNGRVIIQFS